ncbi:hypothetical protein BCV71DRAFT_277974 [Rhizopus microsporus]|uniref:Uncharacterized protein n=1 Tax=Rhizopus microsporus TaxID=58291 RepID=A0A1X0RNB8_RHIZD|nr:hypothetical protein BCV71DRAFT_277974 [Rhizopus microsporus]
MASETISDPLSSFLNMLPTRKPRSPNTTLSWSIRWPTICRILYELDYVYHAKLPPTHLGQRLRMALFLSFSLVYLTLDPIHSFQNIFALDPKRVF